MLPACTLPIVKSCSTQWNPAAGVGLPGTDVAAEWLRNHKPKSYVPGILHGDYQFANVMFHHGAPGRLAAIVDRWCLGRRVGGRGG